MDLKEKINEILNKYDLRLSDIKYMELILDIETLINNERLELIEKVKIEQKLREWTSIGFYL
jgi:hypothetical protein